MLNRFLCCMLAAAALSSSDTAANAQTVSGRDSVVSATRKPILLPPVKKPKPITKELSAGIRLNTDGWTFFVETGKVKTDQPKKIDMFHDVRILQFEFSEKKHPKEMKIYGINGGQTSDKTYIYGKINNFYALKFNYGMQKMITGKPLFKCVSVHLVYAGGLSLGMLKPYYVQTSDVGKIKYSDKTKNEFLNPATITGSAGFSEGIGELQFVPGLHLKTGFHFDFSRDKFFLAAVEVGATGEFYTRKIEMMANQKATPYLFNLYAGVQFGKRRR
jgi:hypothetical protein